MQVDDRHHATDIKKGMGTELTKNLLRGLEEYYQNWKNAPKASCLNSATNWRNRARAAWAAYNGGARKICRWANPNDPYAHHDKAYNTKYGNRGWLTYVSDPRAPAVLDVKCLAEGRTNCHTEQAFLITEI
jgi:hypothetical protein